jgi:hypothetical protein
MNGSITEWNPFNGRGKASGSDGDHPVSAGDCSSGLLAVLNKSAIPPDSPVPVTYDVAGTGEAINVDLAQTVALAMAAAPKAVVLEAKTAGKPPQQEKATKGPVRAAKKGSVSKKRSGKKSRK